MKIVRLRHAFEGLTLQVLGRCRRGGALHLTLVLPDGTRSLVPASWTDLPGASVAKADETPDKPLLLASCGQLLAARVIVDGLMRQAEAAHSSASPEAKENPNAAAQPVQPSAGRRRTDLDGA